MKIIWPSGIRCTYYGTEKTKLVGTGYGRDRTDVEPRMFPLQIPNVSFVWGKTDKTLWQVRALYDSFPNTN